MYIMALSSSMPGRMASSSACTPPMPVVRSSETTQVEISCQWR